MDAAALTFRRCDEGRVVTGVAAGFARRHGVHAVVLRGALVVLTFAAGLGLVLYAAGAAVSQPPGRDEHEGGAVRPPDTRRDLAVASISAGLLLVVRSTGLWMGDALMVPLAVLVAGVVMLAVVRPAGDGATQLADLVAGRHARARITVGAALVVVGLVVVGTADRVSGTVRVGVFAAALSIAGVALLVGPWIAGLAQAAAEERRQRIRSEEREAMAAHLHDSVLQTLALIQRSDDPRRTASLARQQEHELREWLFGGGGGRDVRTLAAALPDMARDVERRHEVRVEVVMVGDAPLDDAGDALLAATREACVNAAVHSGARSLSVYVEAGDDAVEAFVRDRGRGFDPSAAHHGRHGIAQSIVGRMERAGGTAEIRSAPGEGTEVHLRIDRRIDRRTDDDRGGRS